MKKRKLISMVLAATLALTSLTGCGKKDSSSDDSVLRVGMECAYAPFNWSQETDELANGEKAVPIYGTNMYAYGYDVIVAEKLAKQMGKTLEIHKVVEFHKSSFNSSLYYGKCFITTNKIFKINDEDANRIADYVEIGDGWPTYKFLYYSEPTNIEVTYYKNYEQVVKTVSVDKKCFLLGDKYKADYQEAPEGYFYYDTSNLALGKYVINAMAGVQFAIEVVE